MACKNNYRVGQIGNGKYERIKVLTRGFWVLAQSHCHKNDTEINNAPTEDTERFNIRSSSIFICCSIETNLLLVHLNFTPKCQFLFNFKFNFFSLLPNS